MAAPLFYVAAAGATLASNAARRLFYSFASKRLAEAFAKRQGGKVLKNKPSNATIRPGPNPGQPRSASTGRMQKPSTSPAPRGNTAPRTSSAPKPPARTSGNSPASTSGGRGSGSGSGRPMKDITPNKNAVGPSSGSRITGVSRQFTNRAALRADSASGELPNVDTSSGDRPAPKTKRKPNYNNPLPARTTTTTRTTTTPKKTPPKKTPPKVRPRLRPTKVEDKPKSLRAYLNAEIKKRDSSVTAEKKGAEKYSSIKAAKKAGSLYYKNSKTGKIMAAVYKEDLKK